MQIRPEDAGAWLENPDFLRDQPRVAIWKTIAASWQLVIGDPRRFVQRLWVHILFVSAVVLFVDWPMTIIGDTSARFSAVVAAAMFVSLPAVVQWHRYVLIGEEAKGFAAFRIKGREIGFMLALGGLGLVIGIIEALARSATWLAGGLVLTDPALVSRTAGMVAAIVEIWLWARFVLVPPLCALELSDTFALSRLLTRGQAHRIVAIFLGTVVIAVFALAAIYLLLPVASGSFAFAGLRAVAIAIATLVLSCIWATTGSLLLKVLGQRFIPPAEAEASASL